jgi:hypothetical protein
MSLSASSPVDPIGYVKVRSWVHATSWNIFLISGRVHQNVEPLPRVREPGRYVLSGGGPCCWADGIMAPGRGGHRTRST